MQMAVVHAPHPADNIMALGLALLVHVLLLGLITLNWQWTSASNVAVNVIQARVVTEKQLREKPAAVDHGREREQQRKQESARRKAEKLKQQKIVKQQASERRKTAAAKRHKQAQEMMQQQLAAEEAERGQARRMGAAQIEAAKYLDMIGLKVSSKWRRPPGSAKDAYCILRVRITPGGRVLSISIVRSSGDAVFDRATENAIYLAEPLPVPTEPGLFEILREFNIDTQKL